MHWTELYIANTGVCIYFLDATKSTRKDGNLPDPSQLATVCYDCWDDAADRLFKARRVCYKHLKYILHVLLTNSHSNCITIHIQSCIVAREMIINNLIYSGTSIKGLSQ